jgi:hypothetical protein
VADSLQVFVFLPPEKCRSGTKDDLDLYRVVREVHMFKTPEEKLCSRMVLRIGVEAGI